MRRRALPVALVALAVAGGFTAVIGGTAHALARALALRASWPPELDTLAIPRAGLLRVLSLGHPEMASDLIAARANVYYGSQVQAHGEPRMLAAALETAMDLDPRFHRLYARGAAMLVYTGQAFNVEALTRANALLERGEREFPGDWELPFQRGFNLLFELPKLAGEDDARVPEWRQHGVEALREAATLEGAPPWLPNLAARMLTKEGGEELAIHHLEQAYAATSDEQMRTEIARKLTELRGQHAVGELAAGAAALARAIAERYPYAPEAFSIAAGPRAGRAVDLDALLGRSTDRSIERQAGRGSEAPARAGQPMGTGLGTGGAP
jgi:hypothetical protein